MAKKHIRYSTSFAISEKQIKTTIRYYFTSTKKSVSEESMSEMWNPTDKANWGKKQNKGVTVI